MGTRIQVAATTSGGSQNGLASIDVPRSGSIIGVTWNIQVDWDTDNDNMHFQLSFGSVLTQANDSRQVISSAALQISLPTSVGFGNGSFNYQDVIPDIPVSMGERIFLHSTGAAGVVATAFVLVSFDFDLDQALVRRR